jgi:hypothetical protein
MCTATSEMSEVLLGLARERAGAACEEAADPGGGDPAPAPSPPPLPSAPSAPYIHLPLLLSSGPSTDSGVSSRFMLSRTLSAISANPDLVAGVVLVPTGPLADHLELAAEAVARLRALPGPPLKITLTVGSVEELLFAFSDARLRRVDAVDAGDCIRRLAEEGKGISIERDPPAPGDGQPAKKLKTASSPPLLPLRRGGARPHRRVPAPPAQVQGDARDDPAARPQPRAPVRPRVGGCGGQLIMQQRLI